MLIKKNYTTITFPIKLKDPVGKKLFNLYLKEFGFKERLFFKKYVSLSFSV